jgi:hypothetical protein
MRKERSDSATPSDDAVQSTRGLQFEHPRITSWHFSASLGKQLPPLSPLSFITTTTINTIAKCKACSWLCTLITYRIVNARSIARAVRIASWRTSAGLDKQIPAPRRCILRHNSTQSIPERDPRPLLGCSTESLNNTTLHPSGFMHCRSCAESS